MSKTKQSQRVWVIRAGKNGDAHKLFLESSVFALADAGLGDLTNLDPTRDAFYTVYRECHPDETESGSAGIAGKYFRFAQEVQIADLIVYPALPDKNIYVGEVTSLYSFSQASEFPHQRKVRWQFVIPKADFSRVAQYELGAARTFFEFKKNVQELMRKIDDGAVTRLPLKTKAKAK